MPKQRGSQREVAAVGDEVPVACESAESLHRGKVDDAGAQDFVGRVVAVDHAPGFVVSDDGRASESLEDADLDFLRLQVDEAIKALRETFDRLAGQANDQVRVNMNAGVIAEPAEVVLDFFRVLSA